MKRSIFGIGVLFSPRSVSVSESNDEFGNFGKKHLCTFVFECSTVQKYLKAIKLFDVYLQIC